jgi:O-acetyl-ADP-ribose deacetylase (regulator of RNase III)
MFFGEQRLDNAEAETLLAKCIRSSLHEAVHFGVTEIVFPAISCGVYGCYVPVFARIARQVLEEQPLWGNIEEVRFVLFTETELEEFKLGWAGFTEGEESEG